MKKNSSLHVSNMDIVICNFPRIAQQKNTCAEGSRGHLNNPSAHCPGLDLEWAVAPWSGKSVQRGSCFDCWLAWGWWPQ